MPVTCIWRSDYHIRYFHPSLALFCFLLAASRSRLCVKGPQKKDSIIVATYHKSFDGKFSSRITSSECIFSASGSLNLIIILIASKISVCNSLSWNARYRTIDVEIKAAQYTLWIDRSSFGPRPAKDLHWNTDVGCLNGLLPLTVLCEIYNCIRNVLSYSILSLVF